MNVANKRRVLGVIVALLTLFVAILWIYNENLGFQRTLGILNNERYLIDVCVKSGVNKNYISCYEQLRYQGLLDSFRMRNDIYLRQILTENVLLSMVVFITCMGVILSGLQLLASYNLSQSAADFSQTESKFSIERGKLSVGSSIVGVVILSISFAFFFVFVYFVYKIDPSQDVLLGEAEPTFTSGGIVNTDPEVNGSAAKSPR